MKERILNVGCGSETYGTDFVDVYPSRKEVVKCDLNSQKLPFKKDTFDEVYSKNLFEHLSNPMHILKEMNRVLKKGGKLVISTDNAGFLLFHIPIRKNNFLEHNSNIPRFGDMDRHYFLFTPLHLRNLVEKSGNFHRIKTRYHYHSTRKALKILRPLLNMLNKTFAERIINPHIIIEATKK